MRIAHDKAGINANLVSWIIESCDIDGIRMSSNAGISFKQRDPELVRMSRQQPCSTKT